MGLIWRLPTALWEAVCFWLLLRGHLSSKPSATKQLAGVSALFSAVALGVCFLAQDALLFTVITAGSCLILPLAVYSDPWPATALWSALGASMLFTSDLLCCGLVSCIDRIVPPESPGILSELLITFARIGTASGALLPFCRLKKRVMHLPSAFLETAALITCTAAFLTGWAEQTLVRSMPGQQQSPAMFAACLGLGFEALAFVLLTLQLGGYYATQARTQRMLKEARRQNSALEETSVHVKLWLHDQKHHLAVLGSLAGQESWGCCAPCRRR